MAKTYLFDILFLSKLIIKLYKIHFGCYRFKKELLANSSSHLIASITFTVLQQLFFRFSQIYKYGMGILFSHSPKFLP